jgi:hypothetical protein
MRLHRHVVHPSSSLSSSLLARPFSVKLRLYLANTRNTYHGLISTYDAAWARTEQRPPNVLSVDLLGLLSLCIIRS